MSMHKIACSTVQKRYFSVRSCCFSVDLFLCKVVNWLSSLSALYIVELSPPCGAKLMMPLYPQRETNYLWILVRTKPFHSLRGPDLFWSTIFHLKDVMTVSPQFDLKYLQMAS